MRAAVLPHPRVLTALKDAAGPIDIENLALAAELRRDACRRVVADLTASGIAIRTGRDEISVSASLAALSSEAAAPNEHR